MPSGEVFALVCRQRPSLSGLAGSESSTTSPTKAQQIEYRKFYVMSSQGEIHEHSFGEEALNIFDLSSRGQLCMI